MDFLRKWTMNIVYISVLAAFVKTLVPDGKIKKTVLTVTGLIMLYAIVAPVAGLINSDILRSGNGFKFPDYPDYIEAGNGNGTGGTGNNSFFDMSSVISIYKMKIEESVKKALENSDAIKAIEESIVDAVVEEDSTSSEYGTIRAINISIKLTKSISNKNGGEGPYPTGQGRIIVRIGSLKKFETAKIIDSNNAESSITKTIVENVSALLGIPKSIIFISYQ